MSTTLRCLIGVLFLSGVTALAQTTMTEEPLGGDFDGEVESLSLINADELRERDVLIPEAVFLPATQGGHFSLATLDFREVVGQGVVDGFRPNQPRRDEIAWWDVVIEVQRTDDAAANGQGVMVSIDKDVLNETDFHWTDFHMSVGRGVGPNFVESNEFDNLYFKTDPDPPRLEVPGPDFVDAFDNPPMLDEMVAPDSLWWFAETKEGQWPGERTDFWLAINVPHSLFGVPGQGDPTRTRITLRQHASIPEPGAFVLAGLALLVLPRRR